MSRSLVLAALLGPLLLALPAAQAEPGTGASIATPPTVVVVGAPGLRWDDVTPRDTPTLVRLAQDGASGVLSVRTAATIDCPADGWLTLAAGNRVRSAGRHPGRCPATLPAPSTLPAQRRASTELREGSVPGQLADTLHAAGRCVRGGGPGGQLAAAAGDGSVLPADDGQALAALGDAAPGIPPTSAGCDVVLLQAEVVGGPTGGPARASAAAAVDALVARVDRLRPAGSTLLVLGVSEAPGDRRAHLHLALARGPSFGPGALRSASTRRAPYVQLVDVAPTILALLGLDRPATMVGEPWRATGAPPGPAALVDEARKSDGQRAVTVPFFVGLVALQLVLAGGALLLRRWRWVEVVALAGTTAIGASYLANLVPWWRAGSPLLAMAAVTAGVTAVLTGISLLGKGLLTRAGIACGLVAAVIVVDLLTGAHLQMSSVGGYSPVVAGRFAGIGNVAFGVLAAAVLLAAASTGSATTAALTALVVVVDGAPTWGSDVGGVLALVPAYALLVLRMAGRTVNLARLALASVVGALVVTAFGVADHARPADQQSHLGRFVGQLLDGSARGVIRRKAEANLSLLFHSPLTALLPVVVAVLLLLLLRPPGVLRRTFDVSPSWRSGLLAVLAASAVGFALNDSGAAVPALAIVVALPATLAVLARHARGQAGAG
jgi:hypothetical protein